MGLIFKPVNGIDFWGNEVKQAEVPSALHICAVCKKDLGYFESTFFVKPVFRKTMEQIADEPPQYEEVTRITGVRRGVLCSDHVNAVDARHIVEHPANRRR